jgi:formate dehydrogenase iron-sulfur subunit
VLHDITRPELYGGLPANPQIPASFTYWKWLFKPMGLVMAILGILAIFFHHIFIGPKLPQPETNPVEEGHPDEVEAARKEIP